jgi:hypothetical protein
MVTSPYIEVEYSWAERKTIDNRNDGIDYFQIVLVLSNTRIVYIVSGIVGIRLGRYEILQSILMHLS